MKKFIAACSVLLFLLSCVSVFAFGYSGITPSGSKATSTLIYTGAGYFNGYWIKSDGTADCTVTFYDSTTAAGTIIWPWVVLSGDKSTGAVGMMIEFTNGVYGELSATGTCTFGALYQRKID